MYFNDLQAWFILCHLSLSGDLKTLVFFFLFLMFCFCIIFRFETLSQIKKSHLNESRLVLQLKMIKKEEKNCNDAFNSINPIYNTKFCIELKKIY